MIIRSQDKKDITNDMNLSIVHISFFEPECYEIRNSKRFIGLYSTEEKVIKVLDMIQRAYVNCEALKSLSSGNMFEVAKVMNEEQSKEFVELYKSNFIFEMPQDSEV